MRGTAMKQRTGERGSAFVEFMLCLAFFWVPLFLGTVVIGFSLVRAIQVTQVCRDAGHMFAYGTDFSTPGAKTLIANLGSPLRIYIDGTLGYGVLVLTEVKYADQALCDQGNLKNQPCSNLGQYVIRKRIIIGRSSPMPEGASTAGLAVDSTGAVSLVDSLTKQEAQAKNFDDALFATKTSTQSAFVSEMWYTSPEFKFWNDWSGVTPYARLIF
jgi:hypothetical protein